MLRLPTFSGPSIDSNTNIFSCIVALQLSSNIMFHCGDKSLFIITLKLQRIVVPTQVDDERFAS